MQATAGGASRIITFWRSDCAPCLHELAILPVIAERQPALSILVLVLKDDGTAAAAIARDAHPNLRLQHVKAGEEAVLFRQYGDTNQALPYSVAVAADGRLCGRHVGLLGIAIADQWALQC